MEPAGGQPETIPPSQPVALNSPLTDFEVDDTTSYPARVNGRLYFIGEDGSNYTCSASVITSSGGSLLFTAGHCAYGYESGWSSHIVFVPAHGPGSAPYGEWVIASSAVPAAWFDSEGTDFTFDVAVMSVYSSAGKTIQQVVGGWGVTFNTSAERFHQVIGYPADPEPYDGETMIGCDTNFAFFEAEYTTNANGAFAVQPCFQGHGSSGGAFVTEGGAVQAVMSHGYCGLVGHPNSCGYAYGTYFGTAAQSLYVNNKAKAPVPPVTPPPVVKPPAPVPKPVTTPPATSVAAPVRPKPIWCGRVRYRLQHHYLTPAARRRSVRNYVRHCR
jgi:hypothetical protein